MKTVYAFNQTTGQFTGQVQLDESDMSPLELDVYLVPAGCVEVAPPAHSGSEYAEYSDGQWIIRTIPAPQPVPVTEPAPPPTVQQQLDQLDAENTLTQRNLRETIMLMNEAFKMVSNNAVDLSNIPGVAQVYAVEAEAAVLRGQL